MNELWLQNHVRIFKKPIATYLNHLVLVAEKIWFMVSEADDAVILKLASPRKHVYLKC